MKHFESALSIFFAAPDPQSFTPNFVDGRLSHSQKQTIIGL